MITNERIAKRDIIKTIELFVNRRLLQSIMTIISAKRLFKKCANIATKMFSVFRYRIETQTPKTNAEKIEPKLWSEANNREDINIAKVVGKTDLNLLRKTPLKINSSEIGEMMIVDIRLPVKNELKIFPDEKIPKIKFEKYNIPYEKNMFRMTTTRINLIILGEKTFEMSSLA